MPSLPLYPLSKVAAKSKTAAKATFKLTSGAPVLFTSPTDGQLFKITETGLVVPIHAAPSGESRALIISDTGAISLYDYLTTLAAKASITYVDVADAVLSAAIALKASTSYVDAADAILSAAIALKASTTYVDAADAILSAAIALKANLASPALTGVPTAPTASPNANSTQLATTAYADAIAALKANLASPTFTGTPAAPTASQGNNSTQLSTTAYVDTGLALKANLASPALTGSPTAPTQSQSDNSTKLATTAYADILGATKVTGPASVTDGVLVRFDSTTGKLIKVNVTNGIAFSEMTQISGLSVLGNTGAGNANIGVIPASVDNRLFGRGGSAVGFIQADLATSMVTGLLPIANGSTGLTAVGIANQSLVTTAAGAFGHATCLPTWLVEGAIFSNNASDLTHDLDITAGLFVSQDAAFADRILFTGGATTKRFDASWVAGTGNGGMKSGTTLSANTWYRVWAIWHPADGLDYIADAGNTVPTLPSGYTKYAPAFDFWTDSGAATIRQFKHSTGSVKWIHASVIGAIQILSTTTPAASATALRAATPARSVKASFQQYAKTSAGTAVTCRIATYPTSPEEVVMARVLAINTFYDRSAELETDSSGNIYYKTDAATYLDFYFGCPGWSYLRGRE